MTTVAIQLLVRCQEFTSLQINAHRINQVESGRSLGEGPTESSELHIIPIVFVGIASKSCRLPQSKHRNNESKVFAKGSLMFYCFAYRKYPSVHVFFVSVSTTLGASMS
jgi:hypothetical protein